MHTPRAKLDILLVRWQLCSMGTFVFTTSCLWLHLCSHGSNSFKTGLYSGKIFFFFFFWFLHADKWHLIFKFLTFLQLWLHQHVDVAVYRDPAVFCVLIQKGSLPCGELRLRTPHKSHQLSILSEPVALTLMVSAADFCNTLSMVYLRILSKCF